MRKTLELARKHQEYGKISTILLDYSSGETTREIAAQRLREISVNEVGPYLSKRYCPELDKIIETFIEETSPKKALVTV